MNTPPFVVSITPLAVRPKTLAKMLDISERSVNKLVESGVIPTVPGLVSERLIPVKAVAEIIDRLTEQHNARR